MPLIRIHHLERSQVPGSLVMTDASGVPMYISGQANKDMLPLAVSGGFQLFDLEAFVNNGLTYDRTDKKIQLGGSLVKDTSLNASGFDFNIVSGRIITTTSDAYRINTNDQFRVVSASTIYMEAYNSVTLQANAYYLYPFGPGNNDAGWSGKVLFVDSSSRLRHGPISTTYIPEGTNLYFTQVRARQSINAGSGIVYDPNTGTISSEVNAGNFISNTTVLQSANFNINGTGKAGVFNATDFFGDRYSFRSNVGRDIATDIDSMLFNVEASKFFKWNIGGTTFMTLSSDGLWLNTSTNYGKRFFVNGEAEAISLRTPTLNFNQLSGDHNGISYDDTNDIIRYRTNNVHLFQGYDVGSSSFKDLLRINANGSIKLGGYNDTMNATQVTKVLSVDSSGNVILGNFTIPVDNDTYPTFMVYDSATSTLSLTLNNTTTINATLGPFMVDYTETDPVFTSSAAFNISSQDIQNWNAAFAWGDHGDAGYAYLAGGNQFFGDQEIVTGGLVVGGTTLDQSAAFEVRSTSAGLLPPRMTYTQRNAITSPVNGLLTYQTDNDEGLYLKTSLGWIKLGQGGGGGTGTTNPSDFITDEDELISGARDGANMEFALTNNYVPGSTHVFLNGVRLRKGVYNDYVESGTNIITLNNPISFGESLVVDYIRQ